MARFVQRGSKGFNNRWGLVKHNVVNLSSKQHSGHALYHLADHLIGDYHMDFEG